MHRTLATALAVPAPASRSIPPAPSIRAGNQMLLQRKCANCEEDEKKPQTKLAVSEPGDTHEVEADRVADQVMRSPANAPVPVTPLPAEPAAQRDPIASGTREGRTESAGIQAGSLHGGSPLPAPARSFFERRFGHDFSDVRIHTGGRADGMAQSLGARAFTLGNDIAFASGQFAPQTSEGRHLLAHELTHTLQQRRNHNQIQRLKVETVKLVEGDCNERQLQWKFTLDAKAPEDGYLVQNIEGSAPIKDCANAAAPEARDKRLYWEAWPVAKGDKNDAFTQQSGFTDTSSRNRPLPSTTGSDVANGTIKFFGRSVTGDLGNFNTAPADPKSPWGPGKVPDSVSLPSTPTEPSWWSKSPIDGPATRSVQSTWNCCDPDKKKYTHNLKVEPAKK